MAGARLLSAPDRHRIPAPLQIPTKTLKGEKIFSISDKDFPVTPVYFAHVLLTRMGLLKLPICHFTYFHAGGPWEISRGPPVPGRHRPLFFSRFFCWRRRNRSSSDWRRRCRRSRRSRSPACSRSLARACWALVPAPELSRVFLASRRTRFGFSGRTLARSPGAAGLNRSLCYSTPSHW